MQPIKTDTYTYILKKNKEKNIILYVLKNYPIIIKAQLPQKISSRYAFTSEFFWSYENKITLTLLNSFRNQKKS